MTDEESGRDGGDPPDGGDRSPERDGPTAGGDSGLQDDRAADGDQSPDTDQSADGDRVDPDAGVVTQFMNSEWLPENWYDRANPDYLPGDSCETVPNCPAPHAGFFTKGDNNGMYDQVNAIGASPVKPSWVTGVARVRIPLLGWIRLVFSGAATTTPLPPADAGTAAATAGGVCPVETAGVGTDRQSPPGSVDGPASRPTESTDSLAPRPAV